MQEAVSRFRDEDDKIEFYKKHQYINEAANLIASSGKYILAHQLISAINILHVYH
jgi:hypothetical protein